MACVNSILFRVHILHFVYEPIRNVTVMENYCAQQHFGKLERYGSPRFYFFFKKYMHLEDECSRVFDEWYLHYDDCSGRQCCGIFLRNKAVQYGRSDSQRAWITSYGECLPTDRGVRFMCRSNKKKWERMKKDKKKTRKSKQFKKFMKNVHKKATRT